MSQYQKRLGWMVALGLSACAVVPRGLGPLQGPAEVPATGVSANPAVPPALTPADLPKVEGRVQRVAGKAQVTFTVRWATLRSVQAIPETAVRVRVVVKHADGRELASGEVTRGTEPTSTLTLAAVEVPESGETTVWVDAFDADGFRSATGQAPIALEPNVAAPVKVVLRIRPQVLVDLRHMPEEFRRRELLSVKAVLPDGSEVAADWGDTSWPTGATPGPSVTATPYATPTPYFAPPGPGPSETATPYASPTPYNGPPTPAPTVTPGPTTTPAPSFVRTPPPAAIIRLAIDLPVDQVADVRVVVTDQSGSQAAVASGSLDPAQVGGARLMLAPIGAAPEAKYLYVLVSDGSTASIDAAIVGQDVRMGIGRLSYTELIAPRVFIGGEEVPLAEWPLGPRATPNPQVGAYKLTFKADAMPPGKVQLVHLGATASFQPDFTPIASAVITPASVTLLRDATQAFSVKAFDVNGSEVVPINPILGFEVQGAGGSITPAGLFTATAAGSLKVLWAGGLGSAEVTVEPKPMEFASIDPGTFVMGQQGVTNATQSVTLTRGFFLQKTHVTQEQWQAVMGNNPSAFQGCADCPVEQVSWFDAIGFANALSRLKGLPEVYNADGSLKSGSDIYATTGYRLPTEAEWEYAYRAGSTTTWYNGDDETKLGLIAWFLGNAQRTKPVAQLQPNAFGLSDMAGNAWQWTSDWFGDYPGGYLTDPIGHQPMPAESPYPNRIFRGGSWGYWASGTRAANRLADRDPHYSDSGIGFRVARTRPTID